LGAKEESPFFSYFYFVSYSSVIVILVELANSKITQNAQFAI